MNINITIKNCEITQNTKDYIEEKVEKLDKYNLRRVDTIAEFEETKDINSQYKIDIVVSPEKGNTIVATARAGEWFGAIDQVVDKVERQLRKMKDKIKSHRVKKYIPNEDDDSMLSNY